MLELTKEGEESLKRVAEEDGKTTAELRIELERTVYAELVSTIRMMKEVAYDDPRGGELLLAKLRGFERDEKRKDTPEGHMSSVLLDAYFFEFGNWAKMEQRITEAATNSGIDTAAVAELIKETTAKKLVHARESVAETKKRIAARR